MHKNVKGALAKTLIAAMAITMAGVQAPDSSAAKKPALSTKKATVEVKKSKKVTIKNVKAKAVKKLTVKSSKTKIATVKKKGKTAFTITGKKAGKATITAKLTLKGKKKATSLKVQVTVKKATPKVTSTPDVTSAPTAVPTAPATPPAGTPGNPTSTPGDDNGPKPEYTAAPNAGEKRIKHKSSIEDPKISNITIWGLRDNPYLETGYDYTQFGTYSGLFSKWYDAKDNFKTLHELFTASTAQSLNSMKLMADETADTEGALYTIGESSDKSVKSIVSTGKLNWDTKEYIDMVDHSVDFNSRTTSENTDQKVTVVDAGTLEPTDSGNGPAVLVSGRKDNWHGIQIEITDYLVDPSKDYRISIDVRHTNPKHNGSAFYGQILFVDENGEEANDRPMLVQERVTSGSWKTLAANYSINGVNAAKIYVCMNWYGNTTTHDDFYIKDVKVTEIASDKEDASAETLKYSPLYENTEDKFGFTIGGVISNTNFKDESYKAVLNRHFSSMTIDNDLKLYGLLDQDATVANANGDGMPVLRKDFSGENMVKWAYENGIGVRGHTIVCDSNMDTNCKFFFHEDYDTTKPLASKEVMLERLRSIIKQAIMYFEEKYPGTIHTWDVVNEAIDTGNGQYEKGDDRKIQINNNLFYDTIGRDYVEYSFLYAREAVDELKALYPNRDINIKLFYNDFGCFQRNKRDAICALAESIKAFGNERGKGDLIDGVGMQCYLGSSTSEFRDDLLLPTEKATADSIPNAVFKFADLGLQVQFTELTVKNYDESRNAAQAAYYKKLMQMAIDINNGTMQPVLE